MSKSFIHSVIENKAALLKDKVAIEESHDVISYEALSKESNRLSHVLLSLGITPGSNVGVVMHSSIRLTVAMLSCFKTNQVYVPLDIDQAPARVLQMLSLTNPSALITFSEDLDKLQQFLLQRKVHIPLLIGLPAAAHSLLADLQLDASMIETQESGYTLARLTGDNYTCETLTLSAFSTTLPEVPQQADDSNYIFFTSGTTGTPKGILGCHESLSHYVHWHAGELKMDESTRISQLAPVTFDASLKDILTALSTGATLCIPDPAVRYQLPALVKWLYNSGITLLQTVPSLFRLITRTMKEQQIILPQLKYVVLAGEKLYGKDVLNWRAVAGEHTVIYNMYGLTETTILKSCYRIPHWEWQPGEVIPVGKAISNTQLAVINESGLCTGGEIGDVYIKSPYVTKGYIDQENVQTLFVQNPLVKDRQDIVCRTGDLGRYRPDGTLELLGRRDEQVKIHGVRVELDAVKSSMLKQEGVDQVELVVYQDDDFQQELICYYVGNPRKDADLRELLGEELPVSHLPAHYVWLASFPLNINGKVDRKRLPRPEQLVAGHQFDAPHAGLEQQLLTIWQAILGITNISRDASFFVNGGSSLKAIQLISRIYKEHDVQLTIADIFKHTSIAGQAILIREAKKAVFQSIRPVAVQAHYALSYSQRRLWLQSQRLRDAQPFNGLETYRLKGKLNKEALTAAFYTVLERHESLRTVFILHNGEPKQKINSLAESGFAITFQDISAGEDIELIIAQRQREVVETPYDLDKGPLLRIVLLQTAAEEFTLLFGIHHIISDEWSMQLMIKELLLLYNAYHDGKGSPLSPLQLQYKDYAAWQITQVENSEHSTHRKYWLEQLAGDIQALLLPADRQRPQIPTYRGAQYHFNIDKERSIAFQAYLNKKEATLFMGLVALVKTLLFRYTGQSDIVIGTPVAGREHTELEDQIGYYLNTIALRTQVDGNEGFSVLLEAVKHCAVNGFQHQTYPFDLLVDELGADADPARNPLFDVAVVLQNVQLDTSAVQEMKGIEIETAPSLLSISKGDLRFQFSIRNEVLEAGIEYNTDLFNASRIITISEDLDRLLTAILATPDNSLRTLTYHNRSVPEGAVAFDKRQVVKSHTPVFQLFAETAALYPQLVAVQEEAARISYEELEKDSNRLARLLKAKGVTPGDAIGVVLTSGINLVTAMLAVMKSGGVYLPLDLRQPQRILSGILQQLNPVILITDSNSLQHVKGMAGDIPLVLEMPASGEEILSELDIAFSSLIGIEKRPYRCFTPESMLPAYEVLPEELSSAALDVIIPDDAPAYVFYTSGSTGVPKGIKGSHRSLSHYIQWHSKEFAVSIDSRISQIAPVTFDASLKDILVALTSGATLCIPAPDTRQRIPSLVQWLSDMRISILQTVPSLFRLITREMEESRINLPALRHVVLAGERLYGRDVLNWQKVNGGARLSNMYGLTETTILKSCYHIDNLDWEPGDVLPVGKPIADTSIAVINNGLLCVEGEIGEVYISSPYVTLGYTDPILTDTLFVPNPLLEDDRFLVCRTGDIGRYSNDGILELLGRRDDQVKLHGVRIELDGIRQALLGLEDIRQVELIVQQDEELVQELICYYSGREYEASTLRALLEKELPLTHLPVHYIYMEAFPLNINGKVDRKKLPRPADRKEQEGSDEPHEGVEQQLAGIWKAILRVDKVRRNTSFFTIGGSSLKAIQLISRIYKELEIQLTIADIFNHTTISAQAVLISGTNAGKYQQIALAPVQQDYPLSHGQRRLWVIDQLEENLVAYSRPLAYTLQGALNQAALQQAFLKVIEKHESLRTIFPLVNGTPRQKVMVANDLDFTIVTHDLSDGSGTVEQYKQLMAATPFSLSQGPLLRVWLLQLSADQHTLLLAVHHIVSDEWSMQVFVKEVITAYNAFHSGKAYQYKPLPLQYKDYAVWQLEQLSGDNLQEHRDFWHNTLSGELPVLELPLDHARGNNRTYNGEQLRFHIPATLRTSLEEVTGTAGATLFMGLVATVKALLYRYTGQTDIIVGTTVAGREHLQLEEQIGFYVNTLALRTVIDGNAAFPALLDQVKHVMLAAFEHQVYPFDKLVDELDIPRDLSRFPIFDVAVVMQQGMQAEEVIPQMNGLQVEEDRVGVTTSLYDLTFWFLDRGDGITLTLEYNTDLFARERIELMGRHFGKLLEQLCGGAAVIDADFLDAGEKERLLHVFNKTVAPISKDTLPALLGLRSPVWADLPAILCEERQMSFSTLDDYTNRLATRLISHYGLKPGNIVGLLLPRNEWAVVSVLAVLKAGAAYVPMDVTYPVQRISYILRDTAAVLVIADEEITIADVPVLSTSAIRTGITQWESGPLPLVAPEDVAYVMYTSGSTGNPKGVIIQHKALLNYLLWANSWYFNDQRGNVFSVFTSLSFDLTITGLLSGLLRGDSVQLFPGENIEQVLSETFTSAVVNAVKLTPSHISALELLNITATKVHTIIAGGEELHSGHIRILRQLNPDIRIFNEYGPTETTVGCTVYEVKDDNRIYIGTPVANAQILVLDDRLQLSPVGIEGEIFIGGTGVAAGYLGQPQLTAGKFIHHTLTDHLLYRSGDRGRWYFNGQLGYAGRRDEQHKIRGYRIETAEIAQALSAYEGVKEVFVTVVTQKEDKQLVAYYTADHSITTADLRTYLSQSLPEYMVPNWYVQLEAMPLNSNGKVDKVKLPVPLTTTGNQYIAPRNKLEKQLAAIWRDILGLSQVSVTDDFFTCGGHSLKAMQLVARVYKDLSVKISLKDVFKHPTLEALASFIQHSKREQYIAIPSAAPAAYYPVSYAQQRLWVLHQFDGIDLAYSITEVFEYEGKLDRELLAAAFGILIARHEILRTVFDTIDGKPVQMVRQSAGFHLHSEAADSSLQAKIAAFTRQPFDLSNGPLLRAAVFSDSDTHHYLVLVIHHIIADEWSLQVLKRELTTIYTALENKEEARLPVLSVQYKDYTSWQRNNRDSASLLAQQAYWRSKLQEDLPVLELPADFPRPPIQRFEGGNYYHTIPAEVLAALQSLVAGKQATLFMGLVAAVKSLLYRYTGQTDIVVGTPVAGREHPDLEDQIGLYVNTLVLRTTLTGDEGFAGNLLAVRETALEAYANQEYPFNLLVEDIDINRDVSRSAIFDVMIVLRDADEEVPVGGTVRRDEELDMHLGGSKFDITFYFKQQADGLQLQIEYNSALFTHARITRMGQHLHRLIEAAVAAPSTPISRLSYLSPEEEHDLLHNYNNIAEEFPPFTPLGTLIGRHAATTPGAIALVSGKRQITYAELNKRADRLAAYLQHNGYAGANKLVAVMVDRNEWLLIAILGILKSGAGYLPLDITAPPERLQYLLETSEATAVVAGVEEVPLLSFYQGQIITEELLSDAVVSVHEIQPADVAYVIYTSGSTGKPKGVMIPHGAVYNLFQGLSKKTGINNTDKLLAITTASFDMSVLELLLPLINGATVVLASRDEVHSPEALQLMMQQGITFMQATPGMWHLLTESGWNGTEGLTIITGGDTLSASLAQRLLDRCKVLWNMYGPTETTIYCTWYQLTKANESLILGRGLSNMPAYILDANLQLLPVGVPGVIYFSGPGIATGYLGQPELTASRFIDNPYQPGTVMYNTGDVCSWTEEGLIRFNGRADFQVKIRGYRIEPGEIQALMIRLEGITHATVLAYGNGADKYLVAYYASDRNIQPDTVREYLQRFLPDYMVPAHLVLLDAVPLNRNGKVDRARLPVPGLTKGAYIAPETMTEKVLAKIWEEVLGTKNIGRNDNFFTLGGHSLKAIQTASLIYKRLEVKLPLKEIFLRSVLSDLAALIDQSGKQLFSAIPPAPVQEYYPLSNSQERLWIQQQMLNNLETFNMPYTYWLRGPFNRTAFEAAVRLLVERYEILRSVLFLVNDKPVQQIKQYDDFDNWISFEDLRALPDAEQQSLVAAEEWAGIPINLRMGPLLRLKLWQVKDDQYLFLVCIHHIIADEWSMQVMMRELVILYSACLEDRPNPLEPLPLQFRDFVMWTKNEENIAKMSEHREYWVNRFSGDIPVLELPADRPRPAIPDNTGKRYYSRMQGVLNGKLFTLIKEQEATLMMGLAAIVKLLIYRYTGDKDIVLGLPVTGREHPDLQNQIGFFLNTIALRSRIDEECGFDALLREVKANAIAAYDRISFPFELLVDAVNEYKPLNKRTLFNVMLVLQDEDRKEEDLLNLQDMLVEEASVATEISKFDLTFFFRKQGDDLLLTLEYSTVLFDEARMVRLCEHIYQLIINAGEYPALSLNRIKFLPAQEETLLLTTLNDTSADIPSVTIVDAFRKVAAMHPDKNALIAGKTKYTFTALDSLSDKLAAYLIQHYQAKAGDVVAIMVNRNEWSLISILAILKTGAAYLPIDSTLPEDRIRYILDDAAATLLMTDHDGWPWSGRVLALNGAVKDIDQTVPGTLPAVNQEAPAYIIYTSGSTGMPKGVLISHASLMNYLTFVNRHYFDNTTGHVFGVFSSLSFDLTITSLLSGLLRGDEVCLTPEEDVLAALKEVFTNDRLTAVKITPAHIRVLASLQLEKTAVNTAIVGGEALLPDHVLTLKELNPQMRIFNEYGPTETTVGCTVSEITSADYITIGKPIDNAQIYILDELQQLQPVGVEGEIYIGGAGVAIGYLNREELTAARFVTDPFGPGKLYRSGDKGRWNHKGEIEYTGRADEQIKLNGFRIEPGEIASAILKYPGIKEAIVTKTSLQQEEYLVAYYTAQTAVDRKELQQHIGRFLPAFMVPAWFILIPAVPLTTNGKVDKTLLPAPEIDSLTTFVAPRNELESQMAVIWAEVLNLDAVGVTSSFFELGGHSMRAVQLVSRMNKELNLRLSLRDFLGHPTIESLLALADTRGEQKGTLLSLNRKEPDLPRMYCFAPLIGTSLLYMELGKALQGTYNCYGLQDAGFDDGKDFDTTIEQKVRRFATAILENEPGKEVVLTGFSFGGTIAFEVAKMLEEKGIRTTLLLLDRDIRDKKKRKQSIELSRDAIQQEVNWLRDWLADVGLEDTHRNHLEQLFYHNLRLSEAYEQKGKIKGDIIAFKAKQNIHNDFLHMKDWERYTSGRFTHLFTQGDHYDAITLPRNLQLVVTSITDKDK
ncbi:amino acid adenylation domain-containing protein [Chitinophaga filiformis]|uniref:non-ribosomal peptide synthetase n=1 Tax=Chitinophaga filiformis TaxID=104663 RepID=UPI001F2903EF|nr:non-ribosomal peptide synthetase [Chitinophaga filiformis]MCF6402533.1 amino acid adenylation domain-containing protein [Chitinophaga filiformis]MCF6403549.1 amino acid adenylation domain-containing protein [Chitinophaga filiformis]